MGQKGRGFTVLVPSFSSRMRFCLSSKNRCRCSVSSKTEQSKWWRMDPGLIRARPGAPVHMAMTGCHTHQSWAQQRAWRWSKTKYSVSISNRQGLKSYNCLASLTAGRGNYLSHGGPRLLQLPLSWAPVGTAGEKGLRSCYSRWGLYAERWSGPGTVTGTVRAIALSFYCAYVGALSEY